MSKSKVVKYDVVVVLACLLYVVVVVVVTGGGGLSSGGAELRIRLTVCCSTDIFWLGSLPNSTAPLSLSYATLAFSLQS